MINQISFFLMLQQYNVATGLPSFKFYWKEESQLKLEWGPQFPLKGKDNY